jgi:response regulator RpfG family c-di-GMP phosphodiesterase
VVNFPDFSPRSRPGAGREADPAFQAQARAGNAQLEMGTALIFGLEQRNMRLRFVEHCARVATLVDRMADAFLLKDAERADLFAAAQLHEIGMISVPAELIESPEELDETSLARLRSQAGVGAEILRPTRTIRTCMLVEHQYTDFDEIRLRFRAGSREVLLAGILRAADALDTMLHPRPYQADLDPALPPLILRSGRGTNFHPQAVESLLQIQGLG